MGPRAVIAIIALVAACKKSATTYDDVRRQHDPTIKRSFNVMRSAVGAVGDAPPAEPGFECAKTGLTAARIDTRGTVTAGNTEIVSHYALDRMFGLRLNEDARIAALETVVSGPMQRVADRGRPGQPFSEGSPYASKSAPGSEVDAVLAAAKVDNVIVLRARVGGLATVDVFLFDAAHNQIACGFAVVGKPDDGVKNEATIVTNTVTGESYESDTGAVATSARKNLPKQLREELVRRFGLAP